MDTPFFYIHPPTRIRPTTPSPSPPGNSPLPQKTNRHALQKNKPTFSQADFYKKRIK